MKKYFITGTNTDIGKTVVTAGIALASLRNSQKTIVMKPVQTGTDDYPTDIQTIETLIEEKISNELSIPYAFKMPASPHLAAKKENKSIDVSKILDSYNELQKMDIDTLLVEGAGGLLVPITEDYLMIDLIKDMDISVILVTTTLLGTINHTLLSIEAMKSRGIDIAGIIINKTSQNPSEIELDNIRIIKKLSKVKILAEIKDFSDQKNFEKELSNSFNKLFLKLND